MIDDQHMQWTLQEYTVGGMEGGREGPERDERQSWNVRNVRVQGKNGLSGMGE